jgi:hypothetical protein
MSRGQEQRYQLRFQVTEEEGVTGLLGGAVSRATEVAVRDLSLGGAGLVVQSLEAVQGRNLQLELFGPDQPLGETPIEPVHVRELGDDGLGQLVGVRFRAQREPFLQDLCRYLVERHSQPVDRPGFLDPPEPFVEVTDGRRIRRLLVHCCRRRREMRVFEASGRPAGRLMPRTLRRDRLVGRIEGGPHLLAMEGLYYLVLPSLSGLYILPCQLAARSADELAFQVPERMLEGGVRRTARITSEDDWPIWLEFVHPQLPGKLVRKLVREAGPGGLSFELRIEDDLLARGTVMEGAVLRLPDGTSLPCRAVVRHTFHEGQALCCGVQLLEFGGSGRKVWIQRLLSRLNPDVEEATPFTLDEVWNVFLRSGYLDEKPPERMEAMRAPFIQTWSRLIGRGGDGRCWLYHGEGDDHAAGTICTSRVYSKTWLIHHMAVDREMSAAQKLIILADLFPRTAFQWLAGAEEGAYVVGYFDAHRTFNQGTFLQFFDGQRCKDCHDVQQLHLWDVQLDQLVLPASVPGLDVRPVTEAETEELSRFLRERDGELLYRAFDLAPESFALEPLSATSLRRHRRAVVAVSDGTVLGYGLLEAAARGTNIFSLYDTCRVIVLGQTPSCGPTCVRDQLFAELARIHRHLGGKSLLYLAGRGDMPAADTGVVFEAEAARTVFTMDIVPPFVTFLNRLWLRY